MSDVKSRTDSPPTTEVSSTIVTGLTRDTQFAPLNSYINVADFKSAKYLKLLDKNDALYIKHFDWKQDYEVMLVQFVSEIKRSSEGEEKLPRFVQVVE
ncbi:Alpha1,3-fucosyltransferase C-like protein [Daphnia magna]|uniref:Fucosyltransferase n=1 Tax=Daphnia magna TaxID=35525 RepID=A0A164Y152_9CRUS|nr:Alpha1,3-fucosyltransferase C-like protein [Daphnia magna]